MDEMFYVPRKRVSASQVGSFSSYAQLVGEELSCLCKCGYLDWVYCNDVRVNHCNDVRVSTTGAKGSSNPFFLHRLNNH